MRELLWEKDLASREIGPDTADKLGELDREFKEVEGEAIKQAKKAPQFLPNVQEAIGKLREVEASAVQLLRTAVE